MSTVKSMYSLVVLSSLIAVMFPLKKLSAYHIIILGINEYAAIPKRESG